jgi:hypothetical protein
MRLESDECLSAPNARATDRRGRPGDRRTATIEAVRLSFVFAMFDHPFFSSGPRSGVQAPDPITHSRSIRNRAR